MSSVLFVDDEPALLRSFERGLRIRKPSWSARFATSGEEALEMLASEPIDIVISDVSMPGMDGISLLGLVRERHPLVSRVVLSGNMASSALDTRSLLSLHQWLAKPCTMNQLCTTVERLLWARELVEDPELAVLALQPGALPSPPLTFARLSQAESRSAPLGEVVKILAGDPGITAKLLQLVNSAFFGDAQRVVSLERAVALLGLERVRTLVLAVEVFRGANASQALVEHCQVLARLTAALAATTLIPEATLAGLLHEVGRLAATRHAVPLAARTYARLGGLLLGTWGLPHEIATAVAYHREPPESHLGDPLVVTLMLAEELADEVDTGVENPDIVVRCASLGLDPAHCRETARACLTDERPRQAADSTG